MLEKSLENPLDSKEIKPVIPKRNQPQLLIGRIVLLLKLQNFDYLIGGADSLEKTLMLEKIKGRKIRGWNRMKCLDTNTSSVAISLSKFWETVKDRESWNAAVHGIPKSQI